MFREIEHMNFFVSLENQRNAERGGGYNFVLRKMFSGIKSDFSLNFV